jgi:predicted nucleic acid-binding protein
VVIVDTTVWIDYLTGVQNAETDWLDRELDRQRLGLTDLILCQVLQGIRDEASFGRAVREFRRFEIFTVDGEEMAIAAARNYRKLRQRGYTVCKTIDCWIATFCIREQHSLLHRDRDFDPFESEMGMLVVHP